MNIPISSITENKALWEQQPRAFCRSSEPFKEDPGVGRKTVSDTEQITTGETNDEIEKEGIKREKRKKGKCEKRAMEKKSTDRDKIIDLIGEKESIFCRTHIAVGHRIQGGNPSPLLNKICRWQQLQNTRAPFYSKKRLVLHFIMIIVFFSFA